MDIDFEASFSDASLAAVNIDVHHNVGVAVAATIVADADA